MLSQGSDLRLAPTLGPMTKGLNTTPRRAFAAIAKEGFTAVQLDATMPGLRPRELDTSGRRDLAATAVRSNLAITGVDFFIPADHYSDPAHTDRAVSAAQGAFSLAADLGRVPVSMNLPIAEADDSLIDTLLAAADGYGVRLAVHDEGDVAGLKEWAQGHDPGVVGVGVDPASLLFRKQDPSTTAQSLADSLSVARLSDASRGQSDGGRQTVGSGDLDVMSYRVSVDLASTRVGPVVLDLRGLSNPVAAARTAKTAWDRAAINL